MNDKFQEKSESVVSPLESHVIDIDGKRWIQCEFCGLKAPEDEFVSYKLNTNIGRCRKCDAISPPITIQTSNKLSSIMKAKISNCPECGNKLVERIGSRGRFLGCQSYPKCKYTRSIPRQSDV